jgi:monothiol glutaredoxin
MDIPMAGAPVQPTENALTPEQKAEWDEIVNGNDLVLFMKGTPDAPQCGFSARAAQVLQAFGKPFAHVNMFGIPDPMRGIHAIAEYAKFPTLPQIWVKGELIGGSDIAAEMLENGELAEMLVNES